MFIARHGWRWICEHNRLEWRNTINITRNEMVDEHPCEWRLEAYDHRALTLKDWTALLNGSWNNHGH